MRRLSEELETLGKQQGLLFYSDVFVPLSRACALLHEDRPAEAAQAYAHSLPTWVAAGLGIGIPMFKAYQAHAAILAGRRHEAARLLEEACEQIERPGWEEREHLAEVLRLKGWLRQLEGDFPGAGVQYRQALDVARRQQAKSWELRTATSYSQLLKDQGRRTEALDLLQPIYDWFTEGRDTKDHIEAAALLQELR